MLSRMMAQPLSPATRDRLDAVFAPCDRAEAERLVVSECGNNLPFCQSSDQYELERVRYAAMKLSHGNLDGLRQAIELAKTDWRDLLMAAGFGEDVTEHKRWQPSGHAG
jgi:hypothetical protein